MNVNTEGFQTTKNIQEHDGHVKLKPSKKPPVCGTSLFGQKKQLMIQNIKHHVSNMETE